MGEHVLGLSRLVVLAVIVIVFAAVLAGFHVIRALVLAVEFFAGNLRSRLKPKQTAMDEHAYYFDDPRLIPLYVRQKLRNNRTSDTSSKTLDTGGGVLSYRNRAIRRH